MLDQTRSLPFLLPMLLSTVGMSACGTKHQQPISSSTAMDQTSSSPQQTDTITLGAGCFWCVEAVFQELKGVVSVTSGYMGGHVKNPSYKEVCNGTTGHAEVAQVIYDPQVITVDELLEVFWQTHDPTTLNRQGADVGTQYRSAVFFHNELQRSRAQHFKEELDKSGAFRAPIVTEITPASTFYAAENYHQDYYAQNGEQGYCQMVIRPKLDKFRKVFADKLRK
jgi:peptide-methionine (S)-S-oxide reductase